MNLTGNAAQIKRIRLHSPPLPPEKCGGAPFIADDKDFSPSTQRPRPFRNTSGMNYRKPILLACAAALFLLPETGSAISLKDLLTPSRQPEPVAAIDTQKTKQAHFLKKIRANDPSRKVIESAVFNGRNELGVVLGKSVPMKSIPPLTKSLLTQLAREFPGQDLTVLTYAPTSPPMKIGTGQLDSRTRAMTYTPAR